MLWEEGVLVFSNQLLNYSSFPGQHGSFFVQVNQHGASGG